ncbi:hypothetical protein RND71_006060 [Anisodus tanguticus]|uniref:Uncharacterized protein n=1 Tax=Anisodus tanguticus TaxID=243964 RepID=A0AAE1VM42_9SOLA|nr:hypothetical protein RND71_006060 [Anisodus tanguticus]
MGHRGVGSWTSLLMHPISQAFTLSGLLCSFPEISLLAHLGQYFKDFKSNSDPSLDSKITISGSMFVCIHYTMKHLEFLIDPSEVAISTRKTEECYSIHDGVNDLLEAWRRADATSFLD